MTIPKTPNVPGGAANGFLTLNNIGLLLLLRRVLVFITVKISE